MFLSLKTLYRKRTVIWPFYFYTIIRTLSKKLFILVFYIIDGTYCIYKETRKCNNKKKFCK
ncbi:hypothetical protein EG867_14795 [Enterococcus faecalis]|nr:hypothetical protein EG867_14795 [Enterococcus faecalis]